MSLIPDSVMDMFRTPPAPVVQAPAAPTQPGQTAPVQPAPGATPVVPGTPGNMETPTVVADPNNPTVPVADPNDQVVNPADEQVEKPLLEQLATLWETPPIDPNAPVPVEVKPLTAEAVAEVVNKADFASAITPEVMTAIAAGGEEAVKALATAINSSAKQVMTQAIMVNNKLTEDAVAKAEKAHTDALPDLLKAHAASNHLNTTNPLFSNPAIKPVTDAIHSQLQIKNPTATHEQLTEMTQNAIIAMGAEFAPKTDVSVETGDTDWTKFLDSGG